MSHHENPTSYSLCVDDRSSRHDATLLVVKSGALLCRSSSRVHSCDGHWTCKHGPCLFPASFQSASAQNMCIWTCDVCTCSNSPGVKYGLGLLHHPGHITRTSLVSSKKEDTLINDESGATHTGNTHTHDLSTWLVIPCRELPRHKKHVQRQLALSQAPFPVYNDFIMHWAAQDLAEEMGQNGQGLHPD